MKRNAIRWMLCLMLFFACYNSVEAQSKKKRNLVKSSVQIKDGLTDRKFWIGQMDKMVRPMMRSLAHDSLRINMPTTVSIRSDYPVNRVKVQYVEILGRVLSGIAPWLENDNGDASEKALRKQYREWALQGIHNAMDPSAKDFMTFDINQQQLVDASYIALAFYRSPWLWENLDAVTKERMVASFRTTRRFKPVFTNWLLFSGMIEAFFYKYDYEWDSMRLDYSMRQFDQWYRGDGMYGDGPDFAYDYYNSYVIHPYLAAISNIMNDKNKNNDYKSIGEKIAQRNERYAIIQERLINTDGTFPATGRSIVYRAAAFHHLADMSWRKKLPELLSPASVRCALTAVIRKTLESPTTYKDGWLTIGLYGSQPNIADVYNNSGSPYICTNIFLPLGLSETDPFWANAPEQWSSQKVWSGQDFYNDHKIH